MSETIEYKVCKWREGVNDKWSNWTFRLTRSEADRKDHSFRGCGSMDELAKKITEDYVGLGRENIEMELISVNDLEQNSRSIISGEKPVKGSEMGSVILTQINCLNEEDLGELTIMVSKYVSDHYRKNK